jgi:hypothetical protein
LPLALDHTVVLPAANQRLPATLYIAICYWLLVLQAQLSSNMSCKRDVVWYLTINWRSCVMTAACLQAMWQYSTFWFKSSKYISLYLLYLKLELETIAALLLIPLLLRVSMYLSGWLQYQNRCRANHAKQRTNW